MLVSFDTIIVVNPPFTITPRIVTLISEVSLLLGKYEGLHAPVPQPKLRRRNRIRTIKDSLAIEGNTLDLKQVTALLEGKRVLGPEKDILEVRNAAALYARLGEFNPESVRDLLSAHHALMKDLVPDAGKFRRGAVGILKGSKVSHLAPPAKLVPKLMDELFSYLKAERQLSPILKACVFHYELEFIHPFSDGNGRMGRLWQSVILTRFNPVFEYLPVESLIRERQAEYYRALEESDKKGDCERFLEFSLEAIKVSLQELLEQLKPEPETPELRLQIARRLFSDRKFTRKDYLGVFKTVSTATASRDLALGVASGLLTKRGDKANTVYFFK